jgi:hypothetical protein
LWRGGKAKSAKSTLHRQIADAIRAQILRKGWNQEILADHASIGKGHLSRLLNQQRSPTVLPNAANDAPSGTLEFRARLRPRWQARHPVREWQATAFWSSMISA